MQGNAVTQARRGAPRIPCSTTRSNNAMRPKEARGAPYIRGEIPSKEHIKIKHLYAITSQNAMRSVNLAFTIYPIPSC